jgi:hypothetical protein
VFSSRVPPAAVDGSWYTGDEGVVLLPYEGVDTSEDADEGTATFTVLDATTSPLRHECLCRGKVSVASFLEHAMSPTMVRVNMDSVATLGPGGQPFRPALFVCMASGKKNTEIVMLRATLAAAAADGPAWFNDPAPPSRPSSQPPSTGRRSKSRSKSTSKTGKRRKKVKAKVAGGGPTGRLSETRVSRTSDAALSRTATSRSSTSRGSSPVRARPPRIRSSGPRKAGQTSTGSKSTADTSTASSLKTLAPATSSILLQTEPSLVTSESTQTDEYFAVEVAIPAPVTSAAYHNHDLAGAAPPESPTFRDIPRLNVAAALTASPAVNTLPPGASDSKLAEGVDPDTLTGSLLIRPVRAALADESNTSKGWYCIRASVAPEAWLVSDPVAGAGLGGVVWSDAEEELQFDCECPRDRPMHVLVELLASEGPGDNRPNVYTEEGDVDISAFSVIGSCSLEAREYLKQSTAPVLLRLPVYTLDSARTPIGSLDVMLGSEL